MHQCQRGHQREIGQIRIVRIELLGGEHALVDDGPGRQADHVKEIAPRHVAGAHQFLGGAANQAQLALEGGDIGHAHATRDEHLPDERPRLDRALAQPGWIDGHVPPPQHAQLQQRDGPLEQALAMGGLVRIRGQKDHAHAVFLGAGKRDAQRERDVAQEGVRDLQHDAGAIPGVLLAATGAAVSEVLQNLDAVAHDPVRPASLDIDHQPDPARIVLLARMVEPFCAAL